ncbi:MAG TPA: energy transducer TonB [Alphaproteobacteria bacterium]|nr:energy transducer TonB [Alphaproteobacteria bacterium]USO05126.1 MAG: energy transducer TonB [Rhodospirillales bacterium]HOO82634.1 energy transducer TonB [Alphaproteobacteria bacterium]
MEYAPIFVTLVQEPSPLPQTPEKIESPALQNDRRDDVQKALDLTLADPVPAPTEKNEKKRESSSITRTAAQASSMRRQNSAYAGGGRNAEIRYQDMVRAAIDSYRVYPREARRRKLEGHAVIQIRISRSGAITESRFVKTTGHHILDQAALNMVKAASPLPAIPSSLGKSSVSMNIPIGFKLK